MNIFRSASGLVYKAGSMLFNGTFGKETTSVTSCHGHDITFTGQRSSYFSPNNDQKKVNGNSFDETQGHRSTYTKRKHYITTNSTFSVQAGTPRLFRQSDKTLSEYVDIRAELAAARCAPTLAIGGYSNNSSAQYPLKGALDPESGSTEGLEFPENNIRNKYEDLVLSKASRLTELEKEMGEGGEIIMGAAKDFTITAGTQSIPIDSGYVNPVGSKIISSYKIVNKKAEPQYSSTPTYTPRDTYSTIPFGKISMTGSNGIILNTGPGGFEIKSSGNNILAGTGLSHFSGNQVNIVSMGTTYLISGGAAVVASSTFHVNSPNSIFVGNASIEKDVVIGGNLEVAGNLKVHGNIVADGDITAGGEGGISLKEHVHGGGPPPS